MESIDHYHKAVRDLDIYGTPLEIAGCYISPNGNSFITPPAL